MQLQRREPHGQGAVGELPNMAEQQHVGANVMAHQHEQCVPWELPGSLEVVLVDDINPRVEQNACQHCQRDLCCQRAQACMRGGLESTTDLDDGHSSFLKQHGAVCSL